MPAWRTGVALAALVAATPALAQTAPAVSAPASAATPAQTTPQTPPSAPDNVVPPEQGEVTDSAADDAGDTQSEADDANDDNAIIVYGRHEPGALVTNTPPEKVLDASTIQGYGVSSINDLLTATTTLTQSGRGGGGRPVVLVNGRRVSSFREIHNIPPEAIEKMEIFPEEVAVAQGYKPDQRVVNFILKKNFRAVTLEAEYGQPTAGGYAAQELDASLLRIQSNGRTNITGEVSRATPLYESERGILYAPTTPPVLYPAGTTQGDYRTLRGKSMEAKIDGTLQRYITDDISGSMNLSYELSNTKGASGFSEFWTDGTTPCASPSALLCDGRIDTESRSRTFHAGGGLNGDIGRWRWNLAANHDRTNSTSLVDRRDISLGDQDKSKGQDVSTDTTLVLNGPLAELPAGRVQASLTAGFVARDYEGWSDRSSGYTTTDLKRQEGDFQANVDVPIADAESDVLPFLGRLTLNANVGYNHVSDFGGLTSWGTGLNWGPTKRLNLSASIAVDEDAPSMSQLGSPTVITPNRTVYDFATGQTVLAESISGGNPNLLAQKKREWKLGLNYNVPWIKDLYFTADYYNNHMSNPIGSLPLLTPAVESAFPDRITRDAAGNIVRVDYRPLNYEASDNSNLRYGIMVFKSFGEQPRAMRGAGGPAGPRMGPPPGRGGGGMRGGPMGGGPAGGRWNLSLFHTIKFTDTRTIGPGIPLLDFMNGSASGSGGGTSRHNVDLDAGWFNKGIGLRGNARYYSATTLEGDTLADQLRFGGLLTFNLTAFVNFDQQTNLLKQAPFLKGSRLRLSLQNVTNATQTVKTRFGEVPLSYQPGYLDPRGRYIELSFRKMF